MAAILKIYFFLLLLNRKGNWHEPGQEALEWLVARIVPIRNPRFPPIWPSWKSIFHFFSWIERPSDSNLEGSIMVAGRSRKAKIVPIGNPRWPPWRPFWKFIFASSPEPKGQLTWNLVKIIELTCRSKVAKVVLIGNPRWKSTLFS